MKEFSHWTIQISSQAHSKNYERPYIEERNTKLTRKRLRLKLLTPANTNMPNIISNLVTRNWENLQRQENFSLLHFVNALLDKYQLQSSPMHLHSSSNSREGQIFATRVDLLWLVDFYRLFDTVTVSSPPWLYSCLWNVTSLHPYEKGSYHFSWSEIANKRMKISFIPFHPENNILNLNISLTIIASALTFLPGDNK